MVIERQMLAERLLNEDWWCWPYGAGPADMPWCHETQLPNLDSHAAGGVLLAMLRPLPVARKVLLGWEVRIVVGRTADFVAVGETLAEACVRVMLQVGVHEERPVRAMD